jgi:murein endopeptidase
MLEVQPKDSRGYFMLPQAPEEAGYYVYGTPGQGAGQYADPVLMTVLFVVERQWQASERRKFGVGNISLAGGGRFRPHDSHKNGLQVDLRPVRKDGAHVRVDYFQSGYDREATVKLIGMFLAHPSVKKVYFNDSTIPGVLPMAGHNDHFHVEIRANAQ